jgi:CheY-like chemotaxis protein
METVMGAARILVVDDFVDAADSTAELLSIWGYDAIARYTVASALESARLNPPDALILDLAIEGIDGCQFARLIRELPECGSIPIFALSGCSSQACHAKAMEAGISHYLLKPVHPKRLKDLLASEIERSNASRHVVKDMSGTYFAVPRSPFSF